MKIKHMIEVSTEEMIKLQKVSQLLKMGVKQIQYDDVKFIKNLNVK